MKSMNPYCSSGINFYIIDSDGSYSRCYSAGFGRGQKMGNIGQDERMVQYSDPKDIACPFNVECNHGCRNGCDYSETLRFDQNTGTAQPGFGYKLTKSKTLESLPRNEANIYWHLSRLCNYNCVYCLEPHDKEIDKIRPNELSCSKVVGVMEKLMKQFDYLNLQITGGEPSRHPAFFDIVHLACINPDKVKLRVLSNMSVYNRMKDVLTMPWKGNISFWASAHFSEPQFDLDKFIEVCSMARKVGPIEISTVDHEHERGFYEIYFDVFRAAGLDVPLHHQYYDPNRAKTLKYKQEFIPKTLHQALRMLGKEHLYDNIIKDVHKAVSPPFVDDKSKNPRESFRVANLPDSELSSHNPGILADMRKAMPRPFDSTKDMYLEHVSSHIKIHGVVVEAGVGTGESLKVIAGNLPERDCYGFDWYRGTTSSWALNDSETFPMGHGSTGGQTPKELPDNVGLVTGLFADTIPNWIENNSQPIALLHIDCDTYEPTSFVINAFTSLLRPGSIVVFGSLTDWRQPGYYEHWPEHQWKALIEWLGQSNRSIKMVSRDIMWSAAFEIKRL